MKLILLRGNGLTPQEIGLDKWQLLIPLLLVVLTTIILVFSSGRGDNDELDVLLLRFAVLEAETQRLNSLGVYLAKQTNVDIEAFNLSQKPSLGGLSGKSNEPLSNLMSESQLLESIKKSELALFKNKDDLVSIKVRQKKQYLSPVSKGYISSKYGMRIDPINGKHRNHKGVDIAGKKGTLINTIASGFVSFVGRKGGYGKIIEIRHSDSLKSRYAHLDKFLVKKGEVVRKGMKIAKMGSTGRVTGPHLHIEVWKDGVVVNPANYINLALGAFKVSQIK